MTLNNTSTLANPQLWQQMVGNDPITKINSLMAELRTKDMDRYNALVPKVEAYHAEQEILKLIGKR